MVCPIKTPLFLQTLLKHPYFYQCFSKHPYYCKKLTFNERHLEHSHWGDMSSTPTIVPVNLISRKSFDK